MRRVTLADRYTFERGFPTRETIDKAYDDADLNRAIQAYRFFYPTVSAAALMMGNSHIGLVANRRFAVLDVRPRHIIFTASSDTPYGPAVLDLSFGPVVIEVPEGPLMVAVFDVNHRWVADMGVPGPDEGHGGKHLLLPPGYEGEVPPDHHVWRSSTYRVLVGIRSLPIGGDVRAAVERIKTVRIRPLDPPPGWTEPVWKELTDQPQDTTPLAWETNLRFWQVLHDVIDREPPFVGYRDQYGELAALGIVKGQPFDPDVRMRAILERAAVIGNGQMRVEAFADRRPERVVWPDRRWEWVALRFENGDFGSGAHTDLDARDKWFYQAVGASPAMFRRQPGAGSLSWLGLRDAAGAYLDGDKKYRLRVPLPVPAGHFWSVTVYDAGTRSQIQTGQGRAALRSLFELKETPAAGSVDLRFGPTAPAGEEERWIETIPDRGWFAYFRIDGPTAPAFDGSWRPGDFEEGRRFNRRR